MHAWMAFSFLFVLLFFPSALPFFVSALPFFPYLDTGHMETSAYACKPNLVVNKLIENVCAYFAGKMLAT